MPEDEGRNLDLWVSPDDLLKGVKELMLILRPKWNLEMLNFKVFTEGISNQLMGCFPMSNDPPLLVRVYGSGTELFIDRGAEKKTMLILAASGLGTCPKLIATFSNGLVYDYVPGTVLTVDTVGNSAIWPLVARRLGCMHRLPVAEPSILWDRLHRFLKLLPDDIISQTKFASVKELISDKKSLEAELTWQKKNLENSSNPIVFCHNDLLLANIILNDNGSDVTFIDYEYSGANYQAFDIANHFVEYAGVDDVDYSRLPSINDQRLWIREYLQKYMEPAVPTLDDIEALFLQVQQFTPVAHLHWTLWSLVQAIHSKIEFDFAGYAAIRLAEYKRTRMLVDRDS